MRSDVLRRAVRGGGGCGAPPGAPWGLLVMTFLLGLTSGEGTSQSR
ncbi:hypothetical protein [Paractinoplanes deccanensis]|nr:hypothetical protein [Actinoplanes deccanensis]